MTSRYWYKVLGVSLLGNLLTGKGVKRSKIPERIVMKAAEVRTRAGEGQDV